MRFCRGLEALIDLVRQVLQGQVCRHARLPKCGTIMVPKRNHVNSGARPNCVPPVAVPLKPDVRKIGAVPHRHPVNAVARQVRLRTDRLMNSCSPQRRTTLKGDIHVRRRRDSRNSSCDRSHRLVDSKGLVDFAALWVRPMASVVQQRWGLECSGYTWIG